MQNQFSKLAWTVIGSGTGNKQNFNTEADAYEYVMKLHPAVRDHCTVVAVEVDKNGNQTIRANTGA